MWQSLVRELDITEDQVHKLLLRKEKLEQHAQRSRQLNSLIERMRKDFREMFISQNLQIERIVDIVTPLQAARICVWVHRQTWCMELLSR